MEPRLLVIDKERKHCVFTSITENSFSYCERKKEFMDASHLVCNAGYGYVLMYQEVYNLYTLVNPVTGHFHMLPRASFLLKNLVLSKEPHLSGCSVFALGEYGACAFGIKDEVARFTENTDALVQSYFTKSGVEKKRCVRCIALVQKKIYGILDGMRGRDYTLVLIRVKTREGSVRMTPMFVVWPNVPQAFREWVVTSTRNPKAESCQQYLIPINDGNMMFVVKYFYAADASGLLEVFRVNLEDNISVKVKRGPGFGIGDNLCLLLNVSDGALLEVRERENFISTLAEERNRHIAEFCGRQQFVVWEAKHKYEPYRPNRILGNTGYCIELHRLGMFFNYDFVSGKTIQGTPPTYRLECQEHVPLGEHVFDYPLRRGNLYFDFNESADEAGSEEEAAKLLLRSDALVMWYFPDTDPTTQLPKVLDFSDMFPFPEAGEGESRQKESCQGESSTASSSTSSGKGICHGGE